MANFDMLTYHWLCVPIRVMLFVSVSCLCELNHQLVSELVTEPLPSLLLLNGREQVVVTKYLAVNV